MLLGHVLNPNPPGATLAPLRNFFYSQNKMAPFRDSFIGKKTTPWFRLWRVILVILLPYVLNNINAIQYNYYNSYIINQYNSKWPPPCLYLAYRTVCKKRCWRSFSLEMSHWVPRHEKSPRCLLTTAPQIA